jgi:hypothetical protein
MKNLFQNHKISKILLMCVIGMSITIFVNGASVNTTIGGQEFYNAKALDYTAKITGIPSEQLTIAIESEENYQLLNTAVKVYKIEDKSGNLYPATLDMSGNPVNKSELDFKERNLEYEKYGKLDPDLYATLPTMKTGDKVKVWIWLKEPTQAKLTRPVPGTNLSTAQEKEFRSQEATYFNRTQEVYAAQERPITDFLNSTGTRITYKSQYAPIVFAEVTSDTIQTLNKTENVDCISLEQTYHPMLNSAAPTVNAPSVWAKGYTGTGVKVAVVEGDGIAFSNPYLGTGGNYYDLSNPNVGDHATEVAGVIASTHSTYKGIASGVLPLYSANAHTYGDSDIIAATEWAISRGVNVLQNSYGNTTQRLERPLDRYLDHVVWTDARTEVVAAGNIDGSNPNAYVCSPGIAYNVITVGAFDDKDTVTWTGDTMAPDSAYVDPFVYSNGTGRRSKPEVVAPSGVAGSTHMYTTFASSPYVHDAGPGTSYSSPVVSGEAALLMQKQNWLTWWPECVKAIIMASAVHNIEGDPTQSEKDGVGGVDIIHAYDVLNKSHVQGVEVYPQDLPKYFYIPVVEGQSVRVVICWDNQPEDRHPPRFTTTPSDFDLQVYNPSNTLVAQSTDLWNTYEIAQFTATTTGTYTVKMTSYRFAGTSSYVGFAYC